MEPFWTSINEAALRQGDLLPGCWVPEFPFDFAVSTSETRIVQADQADLIVITQSCDLDQGNASLVALCPIWPIPAFEEAQTNLGRSKSAKAWRDYWNNVREGRSPTLHLLASPTTPNQARAALLVDFRAIYSLPFDYLTRHAGQLGDRWRLRSPFLEYFSQAFARSFMRVGLPSSRAGILTAPNTTRTVEEWLARCPANRAFQPRELASLFGASRFADRAEMGLIPLSRDRTVAKVE